MSGRMVLEVAPSCLGFSFSSCAWLLRTAPKPNRSAELKRNAQTSILCDLCMLLSFSLCAEAVSLPGALRVTKGRLDRVYLVRSLFCSHLGCLTLFAMSDCDVAKHQDSNDRRAARGPIFDPQRVARHVISCPSRHQDNQVVAKPLE